MVRAIPNRALVLAKVHNVRKTKEANVFLVDVEIMSSEAIAGYADFVSRYVGDTIENVQLLAKNKILAGDRAVKMIVKYEGDERGGSFYAEEYL